MENMKWINKPQNDISLLCETHCPSFTCSCAYYNNCSYCNLQFKPGDDYCIVRICPIKNN